MSATVYRFGPFELDPSNRRLYRGTHMIRLSDPQWRILLDLVTRAGQVRSKEALTCAAWERLIVSESSLKQNVSRLRKTLHSGDSGVIYIETVGSSGYLFAAPVALAERDHGNASLAADLQTYRAFVEGRANLYSLDRDKICRARVAFERMLRHNPDFVPGHVGLANACALTFEATRVDTACDVEALRLAVRHARFAVTREPSSGEALSTLAFALYLDGETVESAAAAVNAIALERDDWRHWLRLAYINWGEERIRAARHVLALCPGLALAHWLIATVLIARGALDAALDVLADGCRDQDAQSIAKGSFPAVGLHLLRGLVFGAQDRLDAADRELTCELSCVNSGPGRGPGEGGQLYARECAANTWYALGAIRRRQGRLDEAQSAFINAQTVGPGHFYSAAALGRPLPDLVSGDPRTLDAALARAAGLSRAGRHAESACAYRAAVTASTLPSAGWILPVEPLIDPASHPGYWADTLALVRHRAV